MIRNLLIAASAAAVLVTAAATTASAKTHVDFNIGIGVPGIAVGEPYPYYPSYHRYPSYPVYDNGYDDGYDDNSDCGFEWVNYKRWNRYHTGYRIGHRKVWTCN